MAGGGVRRALYNRRGPPLVLSGGFVGPMQGLLGNEQHVHCSALLPTQACLCRLGCIAGVNTRSGRVAAANMQLVSSVFPPDET